MKFDAIVRRAWKFHSVRPYIVFHEPIDASDKEAGITVPLYA
jgi:hypothetical protein